MSDAIQVETRVHRVTVYRNGALVERRGTANGGPSLVTGLPLLFAADSLRIRPAAGRIIGLRETCAVERRGPTGRAARAQEIERLSRALGAVDAEARALDARIGVYADLAPAPPNGVHLPDPERLLEMHTTAGTRLADLESRRVDLRDRRRALERALEAARAEVHADPTPPRFTRGARFELVEATAPTEVIVEYFVEAARWVPGYRLDLEDGRARLRLDALVAQASGEDWDGVELCLGTADLERSTHLPALDSWRIGTARSARRPAFRPLPTDLESLFGGFDSARRRAVASATPVVTAMREILMGAAREEDVTQVHFGHAEDTDTYEVELETAVRLPPAPPAAFPAPQAGFAPPMEQVALGGPMPKRAMARSGGGGGPPGQSAAETLDLHGGRPPGGDERPLRHAWLRLAGPEEPGRGTLRPVDPLSHLWSLVEDHDVADPELLHRAVEALRHARSRLQTAPTPSGTRATDDGFHHVFAADGVHDVPGDGFWHRSVVRRDEAPADLGFRTVPRESRDVFRFCTVHTPGAVPFPSGPMQVYIDGSFRVTAPLHGSGGGAPLELNLGLDRAVRVVDRVVEVAQQEKGLMTHTTHVVHTVTLTLRSSLASSAAVTVYDRLPVAADDEKDVEITLLESDPPAERTDRGPDDERLPGGIRWITQVPPTGDRTLTWSYRLAFPAKAEIVGGNRRE